MNAFLDLTLQDTGAGRLIILGNLDDMIRTDNCLEQMKTDLEDVSGIYPVVGPSAHYVVPLHIALVHRDLEGLSAVWTGGPRE